MSLLEFITTWAAKCWVLALISLLELKGGKKTENLVQFAWVQSPRDSAPQSGLRPLAGSTLFWSLFSEHRLIKETAAWTCWCLKLPKDPGFPALCKQLTIGTPLSMMAGPLGAWLALLFIWSQTTSSHHPFHFYIPRSQGKPASTKLTLDVY